jgi:hypothetical protein
VLCWNKCFSNKGEYVKKNKKNFMYSTVHSYLLNDLFFYHGGKSSLVLCIAVCNFNITIIINSETEKELHENVMCLCKYTYCIYNVLK